MQRDLQDVLNGGTRGLPGNEPSSFLRAISDKPISDPPGLEAEALARLQVLKRLAGFSSRNAEELRRLQAAQAQSRHRRELLEWAAQISPFAEKKLRALQAKEVQERAAGHRADRYAERLSGAQPKRSETQPPAHSSRNSATEIVEWNPDQPRQPKGTSGGGQWVSQGGGGLLGHIIRRNQMVAGLTRLAI